MRTFFLILGLIAFVSADSAMAAKLTLFRWNPGHRAESEPVLSQTLNDSELEGVRTGKLPQSEKIFRGCYLAHVDYAGNRTPASTEGVKPKSEIRKVCISSNTN